MVCSTSWPRMIARFTSIFTTCTRKFGKLFKERTVEKPPSHARRGPACVQAPCTCRPRSELAVPQRPAASARHGPRASAPPELPYGFLPYILARGIALGSRVARTRSSRIPGMKNPEPVRKTVPEVFRSTSPSLPLYHQKTLTCFHIVFFLALVFRFWRTSSVHRCEDSC